MSTNQVLASVQEFDTIVVHNTHNTRLDSTIFFVSLYSVTLEIKGNIRRTISPYTLMMYGVCTYQGTRLS